MFTHSCTVHVTIFSNGSDWFQILLSYTLVFMHSRALYKHAHIPSSLPPPLTSPSVHRWSWIPHYMDCDSWRVQWREQMWYLDAEQRGRGREKRWWEETRDGEGGEGEGKGRRKKRRRGEGISHTFGESRDYTTESPTRDSTNTWLKFLVQNMSDSYGVLGGNAHTHPAHEDCQCFSPCRIQVTATLVKTGTQTLQEKLHTSLQIDGRKVLHNSNSQSVWAFFCWSRLASE